jgi:hypothetical protein
MIFALLAPFLRSLAEVDAKDLGTPARPNLDHVDFFNSTSRPLQQTAVLSETTTSALSFKCEHRGIHALLVIACLI